jgi:hypothetical protein
LSPGIAKGHLYADDNEARHFSVSDLHCHPKRSEG